MVTDMELDPMELDPAICYRAVLARDARYDGRFFTCVKTTGIYCRPICPARPPKLSNCIFVPTAAAAQAAGFRPCLRCRPESSPSLDAWRGTEATVSRALRMIETGAMDDADVEALAERLEIGPRQLRRLFQKHIGAAPVTVAQTRRVLLAKQLIHQTKLSMIEIAMASGFGSVRRFNETFQQMYGRPPRDLRRGAGASPAPEISLLLPYRAPYDWETMIRFLAARAIAGLELVKDDAYSRIVETGSSTGSLTVTHEPRACALRVVVRLADLRALRTIIVRVRRLFDLGADPGAIADVLSRDAMLQPLVDARPGLRVPGGWDGFETAVRAVLGQQITVKAATQLAAKLVAALGPEVGDRAGLPGLTHTFPPPEKFDATSLASLGIPRARAAALANLAQAVRRDPNLFEPRRDLADAVSRLTDLPGIGPWSAQYIAMRVLGECDAFPAADIGLRRHFEACGLPFSETDLIRRAQRWRPWRAYATLHLWMADHHPRRIAKPSSNGRPPFSNFPRPRYSGGGLGRGSEGLRVAPANSTKETHHAISA
jgi:AraC family transcriptional regulator, regulatory protein of adaptative response / DNA-3-methyladenine glycosylase II